MASTGEVWKLGHRPALDGVRGIAVAPGVLVASHVGLAALAALSALDRMTRYISGDWLIISGAGRRLLDGDLAVYSHIPEAQSGPLALVIAGLLSNHLLYAFAVACLLPVAVHLILGSAPTPRSAVVTLAGAAALAWPWSDYTAEGHADDALAAIGLLVIWRAITGGDRSRVVVAGGAVHIGRPGRVSRSRRRHLPRQHRVAS